MAAKLLSSLVVAHTSILHFKQIQMLTNRAAVNCLHRDEQNSYSEMAETVILGDVLKALENRLQQKGLLALSPQFHPLWFSAETERNIFLWRRGLSLIHLDQFEFWIDVPRLVAKRLQQMENAENDNPFSNAMWSEQISSPEAQDAERSYLTTLLELLSETAGHVHALSQVGSLVRSEIAGTTDRVILPSK